MGDPRKSRAWQAKRRQVLAAARRQSSPTICALCHQTVDLNRRTYQPGTRRLDLLAPSIDHIKPLSEGGAMWANDNLAIVHRLCNSRQGAQITNAKRRRQRHQRYSRQW